jgi:hypothetical protein
LVAIAKKVSIHFSLFYGLLARITQPRMGTDSHGFPDLDRDDLRACFEFAAQSLKLKSQHMALA